MLLAIGRRGTPRRLDVPGEDLTKVVYRLIDPEQYPGQHVLVVGGGDSALEAACSVAEQPGTTVTLSHRSGSFNRAKLKNRERVDEMRQSGRLNVLFDSDHPADRTGRRPDRGRWQRSASPQPGGYRVCRRHPTDKLP